MMLKKLREQRQARREAKAKRYADEAGWIGPQELQQLREEHSPLRMSHRTILRKR